MEEKKSNPIKAILYISVWVIIWGTLGSFIDYPLYKNKIYLEGSIGFNSSAELVNGRAAMIGFLMLILTELVFSGRPVTSSIFGIN